MLSLNEQIHLDPVIQADAMQRLTKMQIVRKFEVRIAGLENMQILEEDDYAVDEIIKLSEAYHSPSLSVTLSVGHKRDDSLLFEKIKRTANSLLNLARQHGKESGRIKISGTDNDNQPISLDLLRDAMRESLNISGEDRTIPYSSRRRILQEAWQIRQDELFSMYLPLNP